MFGSATLTAMALFYESKAQTVGLGRRANEVFWERFSALRLRTRVMEGEGLDVLEVMCWKAIGVRDHVTIGSEGCCTDKTMSTLK